MPDEGGQTPGGGRRPSAACTLGGFAAVVLWASTIAFVRSLGEAVGPLRSAALVYLLGGAVSTLWLAGRGGLRAAFRLPPRYLMGCGLLFVSYGVMLYMAVGLASTREIVPEITLINYLWPSLVVVFSVPVLRARARWTLWPGAVLSFAGIAAAGAAVHGLSWAALMRHARSDALPYGLALGAALTWALYSNLSRRWAENRNENAVPLFLLATGLVLLPAGLLRPGLPARWSAVVLLELGYMVLFPTVLAYTLWDIAMRQGRFATVAAFAYATPILSLVISVARLRIGLTADAWVGAAMLLVGAVVCRFSIRG